MHDDTISSQLRDAHQDLQLLQDAIAQRETEVKKWDVPPSADRPTLRSV